MKKRILYLLIFGFLIVVQQNLHNNKIGRPHLQLPEIGKIQIDGNLNESQRQEYLNQTQLKLVRKLLKIRCQTIKGDLSDFIIPAFITFLGAFFLFILNLLFRITRDNKKYVTNEDFRELKSELVPLQAFRELSKKLSDWQKCKVCAQSIHFDKFLEARRTFNEGDPKLSEILTFEELNINPYNANAWVLLAQVYQEFNRLDEALLAVEKASKLDFENPILNAMGQIDKIMAEILFKKGKPKEAIDILDQLIKSSPFYKEAKILRGKCKKMLKNKKEYKSRKEKND